MCVGDWDKGGTGWHFPASIYASSVGNEVKRGKDDPWAGGAKPGDLEDCSSRASSMWLERPKGTRR